jgi:Domain of unknown function (DUF6468)
MTMSIYSMTLEGIVACLLLIAIGYCWKLDGSLKRLRSGKDGMLQAARELQNSVTHADNAVQALRRSADAAGRDLQTKIEEARLLANATPGPRENVDFTLRRRSVL